MHLFDCQFIELDIIKHPLVNQFYKRVYKKGIAKKSDRVFILKHNEIICSAKLKTLDTQLLLTGVACDPVFAGQGYASALITKILQRQKQTVYCFPYPHLQSFYCRLGFLTIDVQIAPKIISQQFLAYRKNRELLLMVYPKSGSSDA